MRALLNSLGFALWASTAIILATGVALVGYRVASTVRPPPAATEFVSPRLDQPEVQPPTASVQPRHAPAPGPSGIGSQSGAVSSAIRQDIETAERALDRQQWQEALDNLNAAAQKPGLTTFDKFKIDDFKFYADIKLQHYKEAESDLEAALATGQYSPEEAAKNNKVLFQLAAQNQQYAKAVEVGKQLTDQGQFSPNDLTIMAQLYYVQKDCKNASVWADKSIAAYKKAGETPKEQPYQFKLQCASDSGDMASMESPLIELIKLTNKTTYWNDLLRIERQDERDDHSLLMIYRVMYNTQSMKEGSDYIEMSQLLGDAALPGEAAAVLNKATTSGLIKSEQQERTGRLLKSLQDRADADKKGLAQQEAEANKSAGGELSVKLGEVYYGFGDYQKAADAINQGLQKGSVKHMDEAYVYLGLADAQLKNNAEAKKAFDKLKTVPNMSPRVAKLFDIYSATLGMPLAASGG
jgi:hypothetical protein